jgi:hypothetical protein
VLVRFNHVASFIVNTKHSMMGAAEGFCVADCIGDCVWLAVPQATESQHIGNQIEAAMIFAGANRPRLCKHMPLSNVGFSHAARHSVGFANGFGVLVFDTALLVSLPHLHVADGISG